MIVIVVIHGVILFLINIFLMRMVLRNRGIEFTLFVEVAEEILSFVRSSQHRTR